MTRRPTNRILAAGALASIAVLTPSLPAMADQTPAPPSASPGTASPGALSTRLAGRQYEVLVDGVVKARFPVTDLANTVEAALSPDGARATVIPDFDSHRGSGLSVLDVATGSTRQLLSAPVTSAVFGPGDRLASAEDQTTSGAIRVGTATDAGSVVATVPGRDVRVLGWTPDGGSLFVVTRPEKADVFYAESLMRLDLATGQVSPVLKSDIAAHKIYSRFRLPLVNGEQRVSYVSTDAKDMCAGTSELDLASTTGERLRRFGTDRTLHYRDGLWSEDGATVTYEAQSCPDPKAGKKASEARSAAVNGIWTAGVAGGRRTRLVDGISAAYQMRSLRGGRLALGSPRDGVRMVDASASTSAAPLSAATLNSAFAEGAAKVTLADRAKVMPAAETGTTNGSAAPATALSANAVHMPLSSVYIHQLWDTEDAFNGNWACAPTSAVMALAGYQLKNQFPVNVSVPYPHTSPYGGYITREFTSPDGKTRFNYTAPDANGNWWPGAYGWVVGDDGYGYLSYLLTFLQRNGAYPHQPAAGVNLQAWVRGEIDKGYFVIAGGTYQLGGSGHYAVIVGYDDNGNFLVNDPYGKYASGNYDPGHPYTYSWSFMSPSVLVAT